MTGKSSLSLFLTLALLSAVYPEEDSKYCSQQYAKLCQGKGTHVGCTFPNLGPGQSCNNYTPIKFNGALKETILEFINKRRQKIAAGKEKAKDGMRIPKSKVMMYVEWDDELAELAQRLADQCTFSHDDCRATPKFPYAGQNVGEVLWKNPKDSDSVSFRNAIKGILNAWYGERKRATPQQITGPFKISAKGISWGHFSQLAVWTLRAVGCGAVRYGERNHMRLLLVCDFSHNNMIGQKTVNSGSQIPCPSKYARRVVPQYPLLCAMVRNSEDDDEDEIPTTKMADDKNDEYLDRSRTGWIDDFWERIAAKEIVSGQNINVLKDKTVTHEMRGGDKEDVRSSPKEVDDDHVYHGRSQGHQESRKKNSMESRRRKLEDDEVLYTHSHKAHHNENSRGSNDHVDSETENGTTEEEDYQNKSEEHSSRDEQSDHSREEENQVTHKSLDEEDDHKTSQESASYFSKVETKKKSVPETRRRKFKDEEEGVKKPENKRHFVKFRSNEKEPVREKLKPSVDDDEDEHQQQPQHRKESPDRIRENQRRDRPERPGALALHTDATQSDTVEGSQKPAFSGYMDKEDMDQLFHDTGFQIPKKGKV